MRTFTLESTHFIFNKCPIYTHDGASAEFSTNSHDPDYSEENFEALYKDNCTLYCTRRSVLVSISSVTEKNGE